MSSSYVKCHICDSEFKVSFFNISKRDKTWRINNKTWTCESCFEKEKNKVNKKSAKEAESLGLPELVGSKAQIQWAETLRISKINQIKIDDFSEKIPKEELKKAILIVKGEKKSSYWIDNRFNSAYEMIYSALKKVKTPEEEIKSKIEKQFEIDASIEATVRPEKSITETVAEISIDGEKIKIQFKEKRDDFRKIVKFELGFLWKNGFWIRNCSSITDGGVSDRAANTGHVLLSNGFCTRMYDENIRKKAISGDYEQECKKWVLVRKHGDYKGWFAIWWKGYEKNYYGNAKRLTGSIWSKPSVAVPPEQFEEVLDFSDIHGFRLSDDAKILIEKMGYAKRSSLIVDVSRETFENEKISKTPPVLNIPDSVEIDNEFVDDLSD